MTTKHTGFHGRNGNNWLLENAKIEGVGQIDASSLRISCSDRSYCCEDVPSPAVLLSLLKSILSMRDPSASTQSPSRNEACCRVMERQRAAAASGTIIDVVVPAPLDLFPSSDVALIVSYRST